MEIMEILFYRDDDAATAEPRAEVVTVEHLICNKAHSDCPHLTATGHTLLKGLIAEAARVQYLQRKLGLMYTYIYIKSCYHLSI